MKPIIGITVEPSRDTQNDRSGGKLTLNWNYAQVSADAGGVPVLIPPTADPQDLAGILDGWLIPGGLDIDAGNFDEENHPEVELQDPSRFEIEKGLFEALPEELPVFGICYGCQFLNVVRGGTLVQHIPDLVGHDLHSGGNWEDIQVQPDTQLGALTGEAVRGKSFHHQSIGRVGAGLKVTAQSQDGIVEAIEATDRPWMVAVQWHPERSFDDDSNRKLIQEFVDQSRRYAETRRGKA